MNVMVCISQTPDTTTKVSVAADGKSIEKSGVKFILNPYDEFTIEEGLRLKEKFGGSVTAVCVGPDTAKEVLRTALAMGADKAILVKDDVRQDTYSVAVNLAEVAKSIGAEIVITGRQSIDFDSFAMAPMVAELLDWPSISVVSSWTVDNGAVRAERDIEGGKETVVSSLPIVISAQKGLNDPRYPKLPDIMKAKSKPIEERAAIQSALSVETLSMELPSTKRVGKVLGESDADIAELVRLLHEEAKVI